MRIVVLGASTGLGLRTCRLLAARGDRPMGLIRNPAHEEPLRRHGAEPVLFDPDRDVTALTGDLAERLEGVDAVVLAAGTGTGGGSMGRATTGRPPAMLLADTARRAGITRYLLVTTLALDAVEPVSADAERARYLRAKRDAEGFLRGTDLRWTILRPGRLSDRPGSGRVTVAADGVADGEISREDVAATICAVLDEPATIGRSLQVGIGDTPITDAVAAAVRAR